MTEELIKKAYYDPNQGFVGIEKLYRKLKSKGVTRKDIAAVLRKQEVYQVNKKNNQEHKSFIPRYPGQEFQIDLIYIDEEEN
jgi:SOS response regulatory protein OraA/RecX